MSQRTRSTPATAPASRTHEGLVVASYGRHCVVESDDGVRRICHPRGKKSQALVGDRVLWCPAPEGQGEEGTVEKVLPRRNLLYRQDELRTKSFAANIDQVLLLLAAEPVFSESQLARALVAAEAAGIAPLIALNKSDLPQPFARAWERLAPYRAIAHTDGRPGRYPVLALSLAQGDTPEQRALLAHHLEGKTTLVLGPSGTGKSTLINLLVPGAQVVTGEISQALNSGRHTTTSTTWYWLDGARRTALIDSPGFQEFGLRHIPATELARCMPDIGAHASACRFYNCSHVHEPGCVVRAQLASADQPTQGISAQRYRLYCELLEELNAPPRY